MTAEARRSGWFSWGGRLNHVGAKSIEMSGCWAAVPQPDVSRNTDDEPYGVGVAGGGPTGARTETDAGRSREDVGIGRAAGAEVVYRISGSGRSWTGLRQARAVHSGWGAFWSELPLLAAYQVLAFLIAGAAGVVGHSGSHALAASNVRERNSFTRRVILGSTYGPCPRFGGGWPRMRGRFASCRWGLRRWAPRRPTYKVFWDIRTTR